jgi:hypothetical protein
LRRGAGWLFGMLSRREMNGSLKELLLSGVDGIFDCFDHYLYLFAGVIKWIRIEASKS